MARVEEEAPEVRGRERWTALREGGAGKRESCKDGDGKLSETCGGAVQLDVREGVTDCPEETAGEEEGGDSDDIGAEPVTEVAGAGVRRGAGEEETLGAADVQAQEESGPDRETEEVSARGGVEDTGGGRG